MNEACGDASSNFSLSALAVTPSDQLFFACNRSHPSAIVISTSSNRGESWTPARRVHATSDTLSRRKLMAMATDSRGVLGVVWSESGTEQAERCAATIYFGALRDGGNSFAPEERLATTSVCGDKALNGDAWAGDYFGLVADVEGRFRLLWSGVRDGPFQLHLSTIVMKDRSP